MTTLEVEGPDAGWVATIGYDSTGELRVLDAREGWESDARGLLGRLLLEPAPDGRVPAATVRPFDEDTLYTLRDMLARRKPLTGGQRLTGHVSGGYRPVERGEAY